MRNPWNRARKNPSVSSVTSIRKFIFISHTYICYYQCIVDTISTIGEDGHHSFLAFTCLVNVDGEKH